MKHLVLCLFITITVPLASLSQEKTVVDPVVGDCTLDDLTSGDFGVYFEEEFDNYTADPEAVAGLTGFQDKLDIMIVLGTWCHDSQVQVPRFFRVLDEIGFDREEVELLCVDTEKEVPGHDVSELMIERVPTFIIYHEGEEVGRIVETPVRSLEEDLLILTREVKDE